MAYLGSTPTTQSFIAGTDYFNGTGAQTVFTLSRLVNSTNDIQVTVNNVVQNPVSYSASGTTLTFSAAPSAGTNNVYVRYLSTTLQSVGVGDLSVSAAKIQDGAVTTAKIADSAVTISKLAATGTPSASTFLAGNNTWATTPGGVFSSIQVFTASGTYTRPAGLVRAKITVVGGGGNGGSGGGSFASCAGGAGGGTAIRIVSAATIGTSQVVTVGGVASTSSFGALATATGGTSGSGTGATTAGGVGSSGDINIGGQGGTGGVADGASYPPGGQGGSSFLGGGGGGGQYGGAGGAGRAYGGGGGGGSAGAGGGAGASGIVIVEEFF